MHELNICRSLLSQASDIAHENGANWIGRLTVQIGPLGGVEAALLARAFEIARHEAGQDAAILEIEVLPLVVHCTRCGHECEVEANDLSCRECGDWKVRVVSGAEMILKSVELDLPPDTAAMQALPG